MMDNLSKCEAVKAMDKPERLNRRIEDLKTIEDHLIALRNRLNGQANVPDKGPESPKMQLSLVSLLDNGPNMIEDHLSLTHSLISEIEGLLYN